MRSLHGLLHQHFINTFTREPIIDECYFTLCAHLVGDYESGIPVVRPIYLRVERDALVFNNRIRNVLFGPYTMTSPLGHGPWTASTAPFSGFGDIIC